MDENERTPQTEQAHVESLIEGARHDAQEASRLHAALRAIQRTETLMEWDDDKKLEQIRYICEAAIGQDMASWPDDEDDD